MLYYVIGMFLFVEIFGDLWLICWDWDVWSLVIKKKKKKVVVIFSLLVFDIISDKRG